jgi:hypothetical protein
MGRITFQDQPGQKVHETLSQPIKSWVLWCIPVINRRITVQAGPGINTRPYLKN